MKHTLHDDVMRIAATTVRGLDKTVVLLSEVQACSADGKGRVGLLASGGNSVVCVLLVNNCSVHAWGDVGTPETLPLG
jgi:hypothetical protein